LRRSQKWIRQRFFFTDSYVHAGKAPRYCQSVKSTNEKTLCVPKVALVTYNPSDIHWSHLSGMIAIQYCMRFPYAYGAMMNNRNHVRSDCDSSILKNFFLNGYNCNDCLHEAIEARRQCQGITKVDCQKRSFVVRNPIKAPSASPPGTPSGRELPSIIPTYNLN
jgi:hypothetical protein